MEKKTQHLKNPKTGKLEGSVSLGGKVAPTPAAKIPTAEVHEVAPAPMLFPPGSLRPMTGDELDWQQDYDDYMFGIEDIWLYIDKGEEPTSEAKSYYEEKAKAISRTAFGKQVLRGDLEFFGKSPSSLTRIPIDIINKILS